MVIRKLLRQVVQITPLMDIVATAIVKGNAGILPIGRVRIVGAASIGIHDRLMETAVCALVADQPEVHEHTVMGLGQGIDKA